MGNTNVINGCVHNAFCGAMPCSKNSDFLNQSGVATDYTTSPPGINPSYQKYLASNGVLTPNGDPLSTADVKSLAGGNFGNFWKIVFPKGSNDCDTAAAIKNIQDKIAQFASMINGNANKWVQANIAKGGGCEGCQGDAAAYIMASVGTLRTILQQYNAAYQARVAAGGGCTECGVLEANFVADQNTKTQTCLQLQAQLKAAQQDVCISKEQALAAANAAKTASNSISTSLTSPVMIAFIILGVGLVGGIIYLAVKKKKEIVLTNPIAAK